MGRIAIFLYGNICNCVLLYIHYYICVYRIVGIVVLGLFIWLVVLKCDFDYYCVQSLTCSSHVNRETPGEGLPR